MRGAFSIAAGFALLGAGAILLVPLPEVGLPAVAVGLRLLGRHFAWARAANDRMDRAVAAVRKQWARLPGPVRVGIGCLLAAGVVLLVYAAIT